MDNLQWRVGDVTITRVVETIAPVPPDGLLVGPTGADLERHRDWLQPDFMDADGNLTLSIHALCIESQGRKLIVDTCVGNRVIPGMEGLTPTTPFLDDLGAAGFDRHEVDTVICTHLHFDHVGWNTMLVDDEWVPTFPNARYVFCRAEWEHWDSEGESGYALTLDDAVRPVVDAGLAALVAPDHRINAEIRFEPTPGHTPGHVAVHIESNGAHALITGDACHHPVQLVEPAWAVNADTDQAGSTTTRQRLVAEHTDTGTLILGTHFAPPCAGYLESDGDTRRFRPYGS